MNIELRASVRICMTHNDPDNPDAPLITARVTGIQDKATGVLLSPSAAIGKVYGVSTALEAEMSLTMAASGFDIEFVERDERTSFWRIIHTKVGGLPDGGKILYLDFPPHVWEERLDKYRRRQNANRMVEAEQPRLDAIENPEARALEFFAVLKRISLACGLPHDESEDAATFAKMIGATEHPHLFRQFPNSLFVYRLADGWRYAVLNRLSSLAELDTKAGILFTTYEEARDTGNLDAAYPDGH